MARYVKWHAGRNFLDPTQETIDGIEGAIQWAESYVPKMLPYMMNELVFYMALYNQGVARKMSFGPYDPGQNEPSAAWKIPVRRISNAYYLSWKVRQPRNGVAILYNDSREAYFIEFGINPRGAGRRVRRPIRKLSLKQTLEFMATTQAYHRVWASIFYDPKRHAGFYQLIQSPGGGHSRWKNVTEHEAAGVIRRVIRAGESQHYRRYVRLTKSGWQVRERVGTGNTRAGLVDGRLPG
jgi:hypothetical protein